MTKITPWKVPSRLSRRERKQLANLNKGMNEIVQRFKVAVESMAELDRCAVDEASETLADIEDLLGRYRRAGKLTAEAEVFARNIVQNYLLAVESLLGNTKVQILRDLKMDSFDSGSLPLLAAGRWAEE